ncbi:MAG: hypothetical protein AB7I41_03810 [Candidatus Sericytochromatia bacterium]
MSKFALSLILLSFTALSACQSNGTNTNPQGSSTPVASSSPNTPLPGGESQQPTDSPQAKAMLINAQNLLNQKYPNAGIVLSDLTAYTTQVVAGSNHRLQASYSNGAGKKGMIKVTIFQDLNGAMSLSEDNYPSTN